MVLSYHEAVDGPAVMQLRKWKELQVQLNLSEFREAFLSPTRELLLLLSYQCEALLLPLIAGEISPCIATSGDGLERRNSDQETSTSPCCSTERTASGRSGSLYASQSTSGPVKTAPNSTFSHEQSSSTFKQYPVVCNVKSLAWGHCGDAYDQRKDADFKELLVVSGNHGITIHCFRYLDKNREITRLGPDDGLVQGRWVEWGPSATSKHNLQAEEQLSSYSRSSESFLEEKRATGTTRNPHDIQGSADFHDSSGSCFPSKCWFRSFLAEVETIKSEGSFLTRFPAKSSCPCSAEVVSFTISFRTSIFLDFLSHATPVSNANEKQREYAMSGLMTDTSLYRFTCSSVFSSSSHRLIGMVLTLPEPLPIDTCQGGEHNGSRIMVMVAMLYQWGIQWLCSVDLPDYSPELGPEFEWTDFKFSDKYLLCLNKLGLVLILSSTTGELVARVDVLQCCGMHLKSESVAENPMLSIDGASAPDSCVKQDEWGNEVHGKMNHLVGGYFSSKRIFKRLMVAFNSSQFATVDDYGVVYVICADDFISEKDFAANKLTYFHNHELGILAGWKIAGSEICSQREFSDIIKLKDSNVSWMESDKPSPKGYGGDAKRWKELKRYMSWDGNESDPNLNCFSSSSQKNGVCIPQADISSMPIRRILLPKYRFSKADSVCFSPFGLIQLVNKCNVKDQKGFKIVRTRLTVASAVDDGDLNSCMHPRMSSLLEQEQAYPGQAIGFSFQGSFYFISQDGLSIVLPSVSVSSSILPIESFGYWRPSLSTLSGYQVDVLLEVKEPKELWPPWKLEVLDRALIYEGPEEADNLCLENGWDLKIARMRRLQLALDYFKYDEIERSLDMLVDVNLAEEGVLRLLFTSVYQIFCKVGNDNEVALASRFLALAACFATKMVRRYGLLEHKKERFIFRGVSGSEVFYLQATLPKNRVSDINNARRLQEMAHFLEIIRNLQQRLSKKCKRPGPGMVDNVNALSLADSNAAQDDSPLPILNADTVSPVLTDALDVQNQGESAFPISDSALDSAEKLALSTMDSLISSNHLDSGNFHEIFVHDSQGFLPRRKMIPLENPKDMIARWEVDNLDMRTVVKDALHSGRLPLAVLQLRLQRLRDLATTEKEPHDTFNDVRDVGRAIAYDLFLKGETGLAIATLRRLGEDIEVSLRQLAFGTVRRPLRIQVALEMKQHGYLGPYEWKILERISLIERLYPSSSFWGTYLSRQKQLNEVSSGVNMPEGCRLQLTCSTASSDYTIECGEVDGAVIGSWANIDEDSSFPLVDEDSSHAGYWAGAAVWSDAWDERTMDRIVLDQPFLMGVHTLWESQLEYHISHNDWDEVSKLLDMIPPSLLLDGSLQVSLDGLHAAATAIVECGERKSGHDNYFFPADELDPVCINVPNIKIFRFPAGNMCSMLLRMLVEKQLAKRFIFLKEYWEGTAEIIPLLARAGFVINTFKISNQGGSTESSSDLEIANITEEFHEDTVQALHKLVVYHCTRYSLPNLLDLYLDHHQLVLDNDSLGCLQEAAGECQWAKWLLLSRIKGCEYDASFSNARSIMSHNVIHSNNLSVPDIDEIVRTIDDIAEGGGEMAALATLMYAPAPIQKCLCSGSVNRHCSSSSQCTLENLRPGLQHFPTLWRTLVSACFGHDVDGNPFCFTAKRVFGKSALSDYFHWRDQIFSSTGGDTSLMQMLPCWFSKFIRRLVQIFVQGPLGWQSLLGARTGESFMHRDNYLDSIGNDNVEAHAISWEATIQKNIEEELYASSFEENGFGVEHHLRRGRALAAFNHLLGMRTPKLKSANAQQEPSGSSMHGQTNIQSDVQTLLAPLAQDEDSILSSVMPLAILHFEDSALVASCAFLLELCGLSASMLRVDVAALRRISSFYNSIDHNEQHKHLSPKGSALHAVSSEDDLTIPLARALAEDYQHHDNLRIGQKDTANRVAASRQPSRALMSVLQYLEKASLPMFVEGNTCGSWLLSGIGDGTEFRSHQKDASQRWHLVTAFCQLHQLPLSTKYLAVLAKDNDWVGFLSEAQVGGFPFDVVVQVASEFNDPRLKIHILTVLRSMQSTRKKVTTSTNPMPSGKSSENSLSIQSDFMIPVELFGILAECEKQKNPGEALLIRAKDLRWSLLAMVASCFPDVSPLSCLTVWLEITAARETSSIKVNDISSQIANSVGAAVESTNALPTGSRTLMFRYNRRNAKRRCLMEQASENALSGAHFDAFGSSSAARVSAVREIAAEEARKNQADKPLKFPSDPDDELTSLSKMVAVLCEQHLFLPLLRAFEMFLPSCSLLPFVRSLQAFSQMRLSEATAHLASFSSRVKEERHHTPINIGRDGKISTTWISSTAVKAADAMLSTCPSAYEKRCLLQLLAAADFGDGGSAAACFRRLYWKIDLAEPSLRKSDDLYLGNETLDDAALLTALEKNGHWEQARNWARQLESSGAPWKSVVHHVTETQAEAMVAEWKEFLWDVPEERAALWGHCQTLFIRYSFPSLQAGLFFLKHAEAVEKDIPARELHEMLLLSLQWLSGTITQSSPVYPLHLLREIETRVWLLAVESEAQIKTEGDLTTTNYSQNPVGGNSTSIIDQTAIIIAKMDNHLNAMRARATERNENTQTHIRHPQVLESNSPTTSGGGAKVKRRAKSYLPSRRSSMDAGDRTSDLDDNSTPLHLKSNNDLVRSLQLQEENVRIEASLTGWEERLGPAELEKAVLSLLEFGQITAAKQLQQKLSPSNTPSEFALVDAALKIAVISSPSGSGEASMATVDQDSLSVIQSYNIPCDSHLTDPVQLLETLATKFPDGCGRGLCKRIIAVVKAANVLGISFSEAFGKRPIELLQLLSLKAQDSLEQAKLLVQTHSMPPASIARILAESFLKGLLAAHRGGYMDCQKEEGPAPLLWRLSDFLKWAELCPSEPEVGHALMRLVITGQEIPHACEVELLILAHHFYKSSACLDGVDVLVALAATRVESYVLEGDFSCLARLVTGVSNFHALNFILGILIENGQLELLLHKYSATDTTTGTAEAVRGFRMAVLTSLKHFNPHDLDAFAMVYNHFDMKHETASLLESRAIQSMQNWLFRYDKDQNEDLLESMRYFIEAAEVHSTIDAGNKTRRACAQASLLSLQIRMPDFAWINLSETNARRALVEQSRFQEALIVAEAYGLNQPSEWALVLWNQMLKPDLTEQFVAEFVAVLPLQPSMLVELARFYRAEVAARGDQSHFSVWLSPGGLPAEWAKHLGRSFRSLLKRTRDLRVRTQLATIATGFGDVVDVCMKALDKVPDTAGPLILRKAHGGAYLPLWN